MKNKNFNQIQFRMLKYTKLLALKSILLILIFGCGLKKNQQKSVDQKVAESTSIEESDEYYFKDGDSYAYRLPLLGLDQTEKYLPALRGKNIGVVSNHSSMLGNTHLVDSLIKLNIAVKRVFSPEHGFRGDADAGENIGNDKDKKTGLPIISLYGNHKKPTTQDLDQLDCILFDLQDVGVRFYTYISTLHYVMEACAENNIPLIVLDRPNPNAHYIDGPIREEQHKSFVGMHPVPIVYGMTIGEYAQMINGESWLAGNVKCRMQVIAMQHYKHKQKYILPIPPSPNLRTERAIALYPSLCFFEGTTISVGRGTERPFEVYGHPDFPKMDFEFKPISSFGAKNPTWVNRLCHGVDLGKKIGNQRMYELNLNWIIESKRLLGDSLVLINQKGFFDRLAGTSDLRTQIEAGWTVKEIKSTWKPGLEDFKKIRRKYLIYE